MCEPGFLYDKHITRLILNKTIMKTMQIAIVKKEGI
jgi:hypothetical protein